MSIETLKVNGFKVDIDHDMDAVNPRVDFDNATTFVLDGGRRYDWPNETDIDLDAYSGWDQVSKALTRRYDAAMVWPVTVYEHGGVAFRLGQRTGQFLDPWDSSSVGLIFITHKSLAENFGGDEAMARRCAEDELETFQQYANGEVYGYTIHDFDGEEVDACWGYFGYDTVLSEAKTAAEYLEHAIKCTGELDRNTGNVEHAKACPIHDDPAERYTRGEAR